MNIRTHYPLDENLARARGTAPVENCTIEGTTEAARALFHDLNRLMSIIDVAATLEALCDADKKAYERVSEFLDRLAREINP